MTVTEDLISIMVCPACRGRVELKEDRSGIRCVACRRVYPVMRYPNGDEIPVMVVEEGVVEGADEQQPDRAS